MEGRNFVELIGYISKPRLNYTDAGTAHYQASITIPVRYTNREGKTIESQVYVPISAWAGGAESMSEMEEGAPVQVQGNLSIRNYDGKCPTCSSDIRKKWAEVVVSNFVELSEVGYEEEPV